MISLIDVFLPRRCLYCKAALSSGVFCRVCQAMIRPIKFQEKQLCSAYAYGGILRNLVVQAKFQPDEFTSRVLTRHMQNDLSKQPFGEFLRASKYDAVTYVPSHWKRRLVRGHDLPALLAGGIADHFQVPLMHLLRCTRYDKPLSTARSAEERQESLLGRFVIRGTRPQPSRILLVDDVTTTGMTLSTCATALRTDGHDVSCFAFAKRLLQNPVRMEPPTTFL